MENRWAALSLGHASMANIPCMEFMPGSLAPLRGQRLRMWGEQQGRGQTLESEGRHWSHTRGWEHGPCGASQWGSSRSSEPQLGCRVDPPQPGRQRSEGEGSVHLLPDARAWDHGWLFQSCRDGRFVSGQVPGSLVPSLPAPATADPSRAVGGEPGSGNQPLHQELLLPHGSGATEAQWWW